MVQPVPTALITPHWAIREVCDPGPPICARMAFTISCQVPWSRWPTTGIWRIHSGGAGRVQVSGRDTTSTTDRRPGRSATVASTTGATTRTSSTATERVAATDGCPPVRSRNQR